MKLSADRDINLILDLPPENGHTKGENGREESPANPREISNAKRKVLALWSSVGAADELSDFPTSRWPSLRLFQFDLFHVGQFAQSDFSEACDPDYFAVILAYFEDDYLCPEASRWLKNWASRLHSQDRKPLLFCMRQEPASSGRNGSESVGSWQTLLGELERNYGAEIVGSPELLSEREAVS